MFAKRKKKGTSCGTQHLATVNERWATHTLLQPTQAANLSLEPSRRYLLPLQNCGRREVPARGASARTHEAAPCGRCAHGWTEPSQAARTGIRQHETLHPRVQSISKPPQECRTPPPKEDPWLCLETAHGEEDTRSSPSAIGHLHGDRLPRRDHGPKVTTAVGHSAALHLVVGPQASFQSNVETTHRRTASRHASQCLRDLDCQSALGDAHTSHVTTGHSHGMGCQDVEWTDTA